MDSINGYDPTLPLDFDNSCNPDLLTEFTITHLEYPDGSVALVPKSGSGRMSPIRARTMKEYDQQITDLKKENFSLKLRIYFLQERLEHKFGDGEDIFKTNIELRVECESLKKEMSDKHELLKKASSAMESVTSVHRDEMDKLRKQNANEITKLSEQFTEQLQAQAQELDSGEAKIGDAARRIIELETEIMAYQMQVQDKAQLQENLNEKDDIISGLNAVVDEKTGALEDAVKSHAMMTQTCNDLKHQLRQFEKNLVRKDQDVEDVVDEKTDTVTELTDMMRKVTDDLTEKNDMIEKLKDIVRDKDTALQELQSEIEKSDNAKMTAAKYAQFMGKEAKEKDKQLKSLGEQLGRKEAELKRATDQLYKANMDKYEDIGKQDGNVIEQEETIQSLQAQIKQKAIENERLKHNMQNRDAELNSFKDLVSKAEEGLKDSEVTIQELQEQLQKEREQTTDKLEEQANHYQALVDDSQRQLTNKDKILHQLTGSLKDKDKQLQEYLGLLNLGPSQSNESLVSQLQGSLKQRDKDLEDAIIEKFETIKEKDDEVRHLKLSIREKEREVDRAKQMLLAAEEQLDMLERESRDKDHTVKQLATSLRTAQKALEELEDSHARTVEEKDGSIRRLQNALAIKARALEEAVSQSALGDSSTVHELQQRLRDKERAIENMILDRNKAAEKYDEGCRENTRKLQDKDNEIKQFLNLHAQEVSDLGREIQRLQTDLNRRDHELETAESRTTWANTLQKEATDKMRAVLQEKDRTIEALVESGQEKEKLFRQLQTSQSLDVSPNAAKLRELNCLREENAILRNELEGRQDVVDHSVNAGISHVGSAPAPAGTYSQKFVDELESELLRSKQALRDAQLSAKEAKQQMNDLYQRLASGGVSADALQSLQREVFQLREQLKTGSGDKENVIKSDSKEIKIERIIREAGGSSEGHKVITSPSHDRQIYISLNQTTSSPPHGDGSSSARSVESELAAVQALRQKLQDDVLQNQRVRAELEQHMASVTSRRAATPSDSTDSAIGLREENDLLKRELANANRRNSELAFRHVQADSTTADVDSTGLNGMSPASLRKTLKGIQAKLHQTLTLNEKLKEEIAITEAEREVFMHDEVNQQNTETLNDLQHFREDNELLRSKFGISAREDLSAAVLPDVTELKTLNQKLKSKVRSLDSINNVLKHQIESSLKPGNDSSHLNPELLIKMAKKIEKLKEELRKEREILRQVRIERESLLGEQHGSATVVRSKLSKNCQTDDHSYGGLAPASIQPSRIPVAHSNSSTMVGCSLSDYDVAKSKQPDVVRNALRDARAHIHCLEKKVLATEATCRALTRKMSYYRRAAEDAGIPMEPPRRSQSESCLIDLNGLDSTDDQSELLVSLSDASNLSVALSSIKSKLSSVDTINMEALCRFGESNDIGELKQQVMDLRTQIENYHQAICDISLNISDSKMVSSELLKYGDASLQNNMHNETLTEGNGEANMTDKQLPLRAVSQDLTSTNSPVIDSLNDSVKYKDVEIACLKKQLCDSQNLCTQLHEQLDEVNAFLERALYCEQSLHGYNDDVTRDGNTDGMIQALSVTQEILKDLTCTLEVADPTADGGDELSVTESKQELYRRLQKALRDNDRLNTQLAEISFVKNEEKAKLEESRISQEASNLLLHEQLKMKDEELYSAQHNLDQLTKNLSARNSLLQQQSPVFSKSQPEIRCREDNSQQRRCRDDSNSGSLASDESLDGNKQTEARSSGRTRKYSPSKRAMRVQEQFSDSDSDDLVTVRKKPSRASLSKHQQQPHEADRGSGSHEQTNTDHHSRIPHTSQQSDLSLERTRHRTASGHISKFNNIHMPLHSIDKSEIVFEPSLSSTVSEASEHQRYSLRGSKYDDDYDASRKICEQIYERRTGLGIYGWLNGAETAMTPGSVTETDSVGISGVDSHLLSSGREKSMSPDNEWNVNRKHSPSNNSRQKLSPRQEPRSSNSRPHSHHTSQHGNNKEQRNTSTERGSHGDEKLHSLENKLQSMEVMNKTLKDELNLYESIHMSVGASRLSLLGLTGGDQSRFSLGVNTTNTDRANFHANTSGGDCEASRLNKTRSTAAGNMSVNISTRRGNAGVQTSFVSGEDQESGILREHLAEIRAMRIRLEESLNHNDVLREQLEKRLREEDNQQGGSTVNIYIHEEGRRLTVDEIQQRLLTLREEIHERETLIAEKIVIIQEKEQDLQDSRQELAVTKDMLSENSYVLKKTDKKILETDKLLVEKDNRISDIENLLKQKERKLFDKDGQLREIKRNAESMLHQKDSELNDAERLRKATNDKLIYAEKLLKSKDDRLLDVEKLLQQRDRTVMDKDTLLREMTNKVVERETLLKDKDVKMADKDKALTEKEALFRRLFHKKEIVEGDLKQSKKDVKRLTHELHSVQDQAGETEELNKTLKFELSVYEKMDVVKDASINTGSQPQQQTSSRMNIDITELFLEMKNLRIQLERCIKTNNELRQKLEENLQRDSPLSQPSTTINIKHFSSDDSRHDSKDAVDGMPNSNDVPHQTIHRNSSKETSSQHVVHRNGTNAGVVTTLASSTTSRSSSATVINTGDIITDKSGPSTSLSRNSRYSPAHGAVNLLYGSSVEVSNSGDTPERQLSSGRQEDGLMMDPSMRSEGDTWRHTLSPGADNPARRLDYFDTCPPDHNSTWPAVNQSDHHHNHPHRYDDSNYPSLSQTFYVAKSLPGILVDNSSPGPKDSTLVSERHSRLEDGSPRHINDRNLRYYSFSKLPGFVEPANVEINSDIRNLFAICKIDDYERLQRENHECCVVLSGIEARIKERLSKFKDSSPSQLIKSVEYSMLKELSLSTENLRICLSDETRLIRCFKVSQLPPFNAMGEFYDAKLQDENVSLKSELTTLHLKYESTCAMMKDTTERLKSSNRRKDDIEEALVKQLSKTERVLRKARSNLEKQAHEAGYSVEALRRSPRSSAKT